ncbi:MAG: hypothetical protein KatS3mg102_1887 [Planctomycetota bacterium]|nr:MAG: hypothetical protein KatS3mg102_1887 [Planctomycetota bacterium]
MSTAACLPLALLATGLPAGPAALLLEVSEVTRTRWLGAPPGWLTFLLVLALLAWFGWQYRREPMPMGVATRWMLTGLRVVAALVLVLMLYQPVATTTREEVRPSYVAVLIDRSVSMTLRDRLPEPQARRALAAVTGFAEPELAEHSRLGLVQGALGRGEGELLRRLLERNRLRLYTFAGRAVPLGELRRQGDGAAPEEGGGTAGAEEGTALAALLERLRALEADGPETALGDALQRVLADLRGKNVAGVVLLSDGRSNAGSVAPLAIARELGKRGIALYAVGVGNPEEPLDIELTDLEAPRVLRAGDLLQATVRLRAQGVEPDREQVQLVVRLDERTAATELVTLRGQGQSQEVVIQLRPEQPGEYTLAAEVEPRPGELIADNNRLQQRLRVIDKRIRVLYIEDLPRYEYRYLRWGLVRDRNMEAQVFQISADPEYIQDSSPGVPPLVRVPASREELFAYHVVILGDVDPHGPQMGPERLQLLREFVEDYGGGLLLIAGKHHMPRAYADTPLEPLLPVRVDTADDLFGSLGRVITRTYMPKLTLEGRRSPLLRLEADPERQRALWEGGELPELYWYFRPREVKPGAQVLATHPTARTAKGEPVPIFALQQVGAGTVFYCGTDDIWRWRAGVGDRYTYRFWGQVIRYLAAGRLLTSRRFALSTDRTAYDLGERVLLSAEVRDRDLKPSEAQAVTAWLERPDGQVERLELRRRPEAAGRFFTELLPAQVGAYKAWLGPEGSGPQPAAGEELAVRMFSVQVPELEKADPRMDERLLRAMASASDGAYLRLDEVDRLPELVGAVREVVEVRLAERELWDRWWVVAGFVGLLGVEWLLRRRLRLL